MPPRRGEIWFAHTPGRPNDPHQPRPALVVSADIRNAHRDHIIVAPIFSWGRPGPVRVALAAGMGGLDHDSMVFCDELATVDLDFLASKRPLGKTIPNRSMADVVRAVRRALGDVVSEEE
jgi:mRNA-degrading endonuclease toxin of MazEF toxin-antitoxin module